MSRNNYKIVQKLELSTLPSKWIVENGWNNGIPDDRVAFEGNDLCYLPRNEAGYQLLEKARQDPTIDIDKSLFYPHRCKVQRCEFETYDEEKLSSLHSSLGQLCRERQLKEYVLRIVERNCASNSKITKLSFHFKAFREQKTMELNASVAEIKSHASDSNNDVAGMFNLQHQQTMESTGIAQPASSLGTPSSSADVVQPLPPQSVSENARTSEKAPASPIANLFSTLSNASSIGDITATPISIANADQMFKIEPHDSPSIEATSTAYVPIAGNNTISETNAWSHMLPMVESLQNQVNHVEREQHITKFKVNSCLSLLSQINAKLDILIEPKTQLTNDNVELRVISLTPVKTLEELESLQEQSRNETFVKSIVHSLGMIHGKKQYIGNGRTVCLQMVDYFFDREFMLSCSWTGSGRNKNNDGTKITKIPFQRFDKVISLFFQVISYSDPSFTLDECLQFLHRSVRNAKQRFEEVKGTRTSVARKRRKMNKSEIASDEKPEEDGSEMVENISIVGYEP